MKQPLKAAGRLLVLAHIAIGILIVTIIGCGEVEDPLELTEMVKSGADVEPFGAMKVSDAAPGAPQVVPEGTPTVQSVGYYSDWKLTKELTGFVKPGKTIFIKVVFSEPMKHRVADDNDARPILYYRVGKERHRFKVAKHGARDEDFVSGDAKPFGSGTDDFVCKYTVPKDVDGEKFRIEIGRYSADLDGNKLPAFYTHTEELQLGQSVPTVESVDYYADWKLTEKIDEPVKPGKTIFIKVVFSEPMVHKAADDNTACPILYYRVGKEQTRFKVAKHGASGEDFVSGDAKPFGGGTDDFVCKYTVPAAANKKFRVEIGKFNADLDGNYLPAFYTHTEQLQLGKSGTEKPKQQADTVVQTPTDDTVKKPVEPTQPEPPTEPMDTVVPTVVSITHRDDRTGTVIADGESVPHGTTINTEIVFSEPVKPSVTYTTDNGKARLYTLSTKGGVHWRGLCKPVDKNETTWLCKQSAFSPSFVVTVMTETTDRVGNHLAEVVTSTLSVQPRPVVVVQPTEPEPTVPEETTEPEPGGIGDLGYTFTFPTGETYPGYNPSANLQKILATHRSAKLPHFHEAVQMVEVINWVYRKVWVLYPEDGEKRESVRMRVITHMDMSPFVEAVLPQIFFSTPAHRLPDHSRYWMAVEYLRLKLEHPRKEEDDLLYLFARNKGKVVGIVNPND